MRGADIAVVAWLGACAPGTTAQGDPARGEQRFAEIGCNGCHLVEGVGGMVGPDLTGIASRPLREAGRWASVGAYLEQSIREPQAYVVTGFPPDMPSAATLRLSEGDVADLVAFLRTLR